MLLHSRFTGEVRRIEVENFLKRLEQGDVVLLTSLGYSSSGDIFNVPSEALAAECAAQLGASKVIFLTEGQVILGHCDSNGNGDGEGEGIAEALLGLKMLPGGTASTPQNVSCVHQL